MATVVYGEARGRDTLGGLVAFTVVALLTAPLAARSRSLSPSYDYGSLMYLSLGLHGVAAYLRMISGADSRVYAAVGSDLADSFRRLDFVVDVGRQLVGTGFIRYLSGLVQVVTAEDVFATFVVFSWFAFLGSWFFFRAFTTALPAGHLPSYARFVFLWPSLVYWPSSIGKESWMLLSLGVATFGLARALAHRRWGLTILASGLAGAAMVRPHVAALAASAAGVAYVLRGPITQARPRLFGRVAGSLVLVAAGVATSYAAARFLGADDFSPSGVKELLEQTTEQTSQGGAAFRPVAVDTPVEYPWAVVTVVFRPFPTEAHNAEAMLSAFEGVALMVLVALALRRVSAAPSTLFGEPFALFACAYLAVFTYVFSAVGNFGILARQRTMLLPLLFVLLALEYARGTVRLSPTSSRRR